MNDDGAFPTMIIPRGTEITANESGQLSIRTPGGLVIQNPGTYSVIECSSGSVRIDPDVKVEASSIRAADACTIAGSLTAWRVKARRIVIEKGAQAFIMLRESETLELDPQARLVGNFASEQELYLFMGRFNSELRDLPNALAPGEAAVKLGAGNAPTGRNAAPPMTPPAAGPREDPFAVPAAAPPRSDVMAPFGAAVAEELRRPDLPPEARQALSSLLQTVRSGEIEHVRGAYASLLARVPSPSHNLREARRRLEAYFAAASPWPGTLDG